MTNFYSELIHDYKKEHKIKMCTENQLRLWILTMGHVSQGYEVDLESCRVVIIPGEFDQHRKVLPYEISKETAQKIRQILDSHEFQTMQEASEMIVRDGTAVMVELQSENKPIYIQRYTFEKNQIVSKLRELIIPPD